MELLVLSDRRLETIEQWQRAIASEGFPLELSADASLDASHGFLMVQIGERATDFHWARRSARELMGKNPKIRPGHRWRYALAIRQDRSDSLATAAFFMAVAAYAKATKGIIRERDSVFTARQVAEMARAFELVRPACEALYERAGPWLEERDARPQARDDVEWTVTARRVN